MVLGPYGFLGQWLCLDWLCHSLFAGHWILDLASNIIARPRASPLHHPTRTTIFAKTVFPVFGK